MWEGRGTTEDIVEDYVSSGYLEKHLGTPDRVYDSRIVRGMVTKCLDIDYFVQSLFHQLHLTALFRQLHILTISQVSAVEISILPILEQIKKPKIWDGIIPAYSPNIELPLCHTLQWLDLRHSTFSWTLGRTFKALEACTLHSVKQESDNIYEYKELQVVLPACTKLDWIGTPEDFYRVSCPSVQLLDWWQSKPVSPVAEVILKSLHDFLLNSSCLQTLKIGVSYYSGLDSFIKFIFCDSLEQGVWRNIKFVGMLVQFHLDEPKEPFFRMVGHQRHYEEGWKKFMVRKEESNYVTLTALM